MLQADGAHSLGDTGGFAVDDCSGGLWRDIAWGEPCAARSEDEVELFLVAPLAQRALDQCAFVGNDCARADDCFRQLGGDHRPDIFAAGVFASALCTAVANGQNSDRNHGIYPRAANSRIMAPIWRREPKSQTVYSSDRSSTSTWHCISWASLRATCSGGVSGTWSVAKSAGSMLLLTPPVSGLECCSASPEIFS